MHSKISILLCVLALSSFCQCQAPNLPCVGSERDGVYSFTINSTSTSSSTMINLMYVQHDAYRGIPLSTTTLHNELNQLKNFSRQDDFRRHPCPDIYGYQPICENTFGMTDAQKLASSRTAFDRGHVTPANPYRFSEDALSNTFYCVNIAPQDPWTNQSPWAIVESKALDYFTNRAGYVMTGVCDLDDKHSPTLIGYRVPSCYWKLICYVDTAGETQVVGFIGNNTLLDYSAPNDSPVKNERRNSTLTPRGQQEILDEMLVRRQSFIEEAWEGAEQYLLVNRNELRAPEAAQCWDKRTISEAVESEWIAVMQEGLEEFEEAEIINRYEK